MYEENLTRDESVKVNKVKTEFCALYLENIKRNGSAELLKYLTDSDFFVAPASTRFHCAYVGGLCEHSINVYKRLLSGVKAEYGENYKNLYSDETIAVVGLLHDICKVNYYAVDYRNQKNDAGIWVKVPYYTVREKFPYGHGEKSVFLIHSFMKIEPDEAMAINWHMGGFDERVKGGSYSISEAFAKNKLCVLVHMADLLATYIDEER